MKIKEKKYKIEKATRLGAYSEGRGQEFIAEALYITKKGEFFTYGRGGKETAYFLLFEDSRGIIPLKKKSALEWCKEHACIEVIEDYFGDMVED